MRTVVFSALVNLALLCLGSVFWTSAALAPRNDDIVFILMFPIVKKLNGQEDTIDISGTKRFAAALMAIDHVNNKTDGFFDDLLPNRTIKYLFYDSKRSEGSSWWNVAKFSDSYFASKVTTPQYIVMGPASSSPTLAVNGALKDGKINIPQISYSATSATLSSGMQLFSRTVPSDDEKARIMHGLITEEGNYFPCIVYGDDAFSIGLAKTLSASLESFTPVQFVTGKLAVDDIEIPKASCSAIVIFAQETDIKHIGSYLMKSRSLEELKATRVYTIETAETLFQSYASSSDEKQNALVHETRVLMSLSNLSSPTYATLQKAWHARTKDSCDSVENAEKPGACSTEAQTYLFKHERKQNGSSVNNSVCVAFDYSDYVKSDDPNFPFETSGPGHIDSLTPFAYDAVIAAAHGLNNSRDTADELHKAIVQSQFDGFSGRVKFSEATGARTLDTSTFYIMTFTKGNATYTESKAFRRDHSSAWSPFQPDCEASELTFSFGCSASTTTINVASVEHAKCDCVSTSCPNCCVKKDRRWDDEISKLAMECDYIPSESPASVGLVVLACLAMALNVGVILYMFFSRKNEIIHNAQHEMLFVIMVGSILMSSWSLLLLPAQSEQVCFAQMWLFHMGLPMILFALFVRGWRIHALFNAKKLGRKAGISMRAIWPKLLLAFALLVLLLGVRSLVHSSGLYSMGWTLRTIPKDVKVDGLLIGTLATDVCQGNSAVDAVLYTFYGIIIVASCYLTYRIRKVSERYQDSAQLGAFWLNVFVVLLVFFVLELSSNIDYLQRQLIVRLASNVELMLLTILLSFPKICMVLHRVPAVKETPREVELRRRAEGEIILAREKIAQLEATIVSLVEKIEHGPETRKIKSNPNFMPHKMQPNGAREGENRTSLPPHFL